MSSNPFEALWAFGYNRLVPIIPPSAPISEKSNISKRIAKGEDPRGKAPGIMWQDGTWSGYDWVPHESDERDLTRWHAMRAGAGIKTGSVGQYSLIAIDADTLDKSCAAIIKGEIEKTFGILPIRVGQEPKALYVLRVNGKTPYQRIDFNPGTNGKHERVEILSDGKQFVAYGIHPKTKEPYRWTQKLIPFDDLKTVEPEAIEAFLSSLKTMLPQALQPVKEGVGNAVEQSSLKGDLAVVARAVANTPNTSALFPTRESYRDFGYAIKASLPDNEPEALELYQDWCARWTGGTNEPDIVNADWRRMKGPFRRGASWLYDIAEQYSEGKFSSSEQWFEAPPPEKPATADGFFFDDNEPVSLPPALVKGLIPFEGVCFIGGQSGAGKTFLVCDLAVSLASGVDFFSKKIKEKVGVIILAGEGAATLKTRLRAIRISKGLDEASLPIAWLGAVPNLADAAEVAKLIPRLKAVASLFQERYGVRLGMVVYDTLAATFSLSDENDNSEASKIIRMMNHVGAAVGCVQVPVHHYGKGAETGLRGASGWRAGCDAVLSVTCDRNQVTGETSNHYLSLSKNRVGEEGPIGPFELRKINLGTDEDGESFGSCYVVPGALYEDAKPTDDKDKENDALAALSTGDWKKDMQAGDLWAGRPIADAFDMDLAISSNEKSVKTLIKEWLKTGKLIEYQKMNEHRKMRKFVRSTVKISGENDEENEENERGQDVKIQLVRNDEKLYDTSRISAGDAKVTQAKSLFD